MPYRVRHCLVPSLVIKFPTLLQPASSDRLRKSLLNALMNGVATFQMQFERPFCTMHRPETVTMGDPSSTDTLSEVVGSRKRHACSKKARFIPKDDELLLSLREGEAQSWTMSIRFNAVFPPRSHSSLQLHYSTKLKRCTKP